jgi:hypothetical protein
MVSTLFAQEKNGKALVRGRVPELSAERAAGDVRQEREKKKTNEESRRPP